MTRDKTEGGPPFDREKVLEEARGLIARFGDKKKAERAAMNRQAGNGPSTPGVYYWGAVAQAIRKMK